MSDKLSLVWKVEKSHRSSYTDGKVFLSHQGHFLACSNAEAVTLLCCATGEIMKTISLPNDGFTSFALHPNDSDLCVSCRSGMIRIFSIETQQVLRQFRGHDLPVTDMIYDPTGFCFTLPFFHSTRFSSVHHALLRHFSSNWLHRPFCDSLGCKSKLLYSQFFGPSCCHSACPLSSWSY